MWWDCIIPELRFKMFPEVSAPMNVVDCIIPKLRFKMYPEVSAPVKVVDCIVRIINPPLSKFGHMSNLGVMSKSGVHLVYL